MRPPHTTYVWVVWGGLTLSQYTTSEDDAEYSWIGWFCSRKGHEFLCEVCVCTRACACVLACVSMLRMPKRGEHILVCVAVEMSGCVCWCGCGCEREIHRGRERQCVCVCVFSLSHTRQYICYISYLRANLLHLLHLLRRCIVSSVKALFRLY